MLSRFWMLLAMVAATGLVFGCGASSTVESAVAPDAAYLFTAEPAGAVGVGEAKAAAETPEEVTLVGRIGGSAKPFVEGIAAFTIVDPKVAYCADDEGCPTPWDYCCNTTQAKENSAMVKVVDPTGNPVAKDARGLLGVKELAIVVVHGKPERDEQGNLTVLADKVFVKELK